MQIRRSDDLRVVNPEGGTAAFGTENRNMKRTMIYIFSNLSLRIARDNLDDNDREEKVRHREIL